MAAEETREPPPDDLEVNTKARAHELDPTLGVPVQVDRAGTPRNRLVTVGDSVTHGFMSLAIFRTEMSWPAIVAHELGSSDTFRYPVYERPDGPGGIPIDIERALRAFEKKFGAKLDWYEIVGAIRWLHKHLDAIETYWERGDGSKPPAGGGILHNLAIYGWDLRDTLSLTSTKLKDRIPPPTDNVLPWREKVEKDNDRAALVVLESARGPGGEALTPFGAARALGAEGTDLSEDGPGIETLVVILGSNNALQSVTKLELVWSGDDYEDLEAKDDYTVWKPEHFAAEWALVVAELRRIRARHVIVGTIPAVTIAPIARGVGKKIRPDSRYFPHYTKPWIQDDQFDRDIDPALTAMDARVIDSAIDAYNRTIIDSVAAARQNGLDWYLFDLGALLDRLATKRYAKGETTRPDGWTPYPLPPVLANLEPKLGTRFFSSGPDGRHTETGLFSLDGIHPTTIGYGIIAQEVMRVMELAGVEFHGPAGEVRQPPVDVDFARVLAADTLIAKPPTSLDGNLATLGWLDDKLDWVRKLF